MSRREAAKNGRTRRFLAEQFEGADLPVDRLHVERLAADLQAPQVGLQPGVGVEYVRGNLVEPGRQGPAQVELVGAPVRGQGGVEAVGQQVRGADALRPVDRLVGEPGAAVGPAGVGPAAGERGGQPGPGRVVGGAGQHVVQLGRQFARRRRRTGRPTPRRAPPGSSRRGRPSDRHRVNASSYRRAATSPRPAVRAASARSRRSATVCGWVTTPQSRVAVNPVVTRSGPDQPYGIGVLALFRLVPVAGAVDRQSVMVSPTTSARIISRQYQRCPSCSQRSSNSIVKP